MYHEEKRTDTAFARELMRHGEFATLATVNPDGTPYCIPISTVMLDEKLYIHCALEGKKCDNMAHNPHVCLSCVGYTKLLPEKFTTEFDSVVVLGTVRRVEEDDEKTKMLYALCEKYAASSIATAPRVIQKLLDRTAVYEVQITEITGKSNHFA